MELTLAVLGLARLGSILRERRAAERRVVAETA